MTVKFGVFESLCAGYGLGGACEVPDNFWREGHAMLTAVCDSLAASKVVRAVPFIHHQWVNESNSQNNAIVLNGTNDQSILHEVFEAVERESLAGMVVIAPEINGELKRLVSALRTRTRVWNCADTFLELASDKWLVAKYCQRKGLPHPKTHLLAELKTETSWGLFPGEVVIKARHGAGCIDIAVFDSWSDAKKFAISKSLYDSEDDWIVQDWIAGQHVSRSLVCSGGTAVRMPTVEQKITLKRSDGSFSGRLPSYEGASSFPQASEGLGLHVLNQVFGDFKNQCLGWIGFDLLVPDLPVSHENCYLIEINPRFTTSFVYLQQSHQQSIIARPIADFIQAQ